MDEQVPGLKQPLKPLVSVIMSVYNGEQFLQQAIESILSQTYPNWEFIIIDDASNEATQGILMQYKNDRRFKIVRLEVNRGLTKNLNQAIELSSGEFIARMDADDISLSNRFENQINFLQQHTGTMAVFGLVELIDEYGNSIGQWGDDIKAITYQRIRRRLPFSNCVAHPSVMIRKDVLQHYKYNEEQIHSQDWDLWLRMVSDGKIVEKINATVLLYRIHKNSITKISNKKSAFLKMHKSYKPYLKHVWKEKKINSFNFLVYVGFFLNAIKLGLSRIKRSFF
jgi:glycosyltransferase involved in cell wall biosynthesis